MLADGLEKACRACASRNLPGGGVLGILDHHAHRRQFIADTVGLPKILAGAGSGASSNQTVDQACIDAARVLLSTVPLRRSLRQETQKPQGSSKPAAIGFVSGGRLVPQTRQRGD